MTVRTALGRGLAATGRAALAVAAVAGVLSAVLFGAVRTGQLATVSVTTGSMRPAIQAGDLIISRPTPAAGLEVGDVVTVRSTYTGGLVTHRVVDVAPGSSPGTAALRLKGDANAEPDYEIYEVDEVLRHKATVRHAGEAVDLLTTPPGVYFAALAIAAAIGFTFLPREESTGQVAEPEFESARTHT